MQPRAQVSTPSPYRSARSSSGERYQRVTTRGVQPPPAAPEPPPSPEAASSPEVVVSPEPVPPEPVPSVPPPAAASSDDEESDSESDYDEEASVVEEGQEVEVERVWRIGAPIPVRIHGN